MSTDQAEVLQRFDRLREACERTGLKMTHQRMMIFKAVVETDEHPDVETVFRAVRNDIPTISLDTVYRALWLLKDLGVISTIGPLREKVRFDADTSRHHHFICSKCGLAKDVHCSEFDALPIPRDVSDAGRVEVIHVELRGLCSNCLDLKQELTEDPECSQGGRL